jgi:hypothetical protein
MDQEVLIPESRLRLREIIGESFLELPEDHGLFMQLYRTPMNWTGPTSRVEL